MDSLYLLIPIALLFCVIAIRLLLWAISSGQYDDLDKEAWRVLGDEDPASIDGTDTGTETAATNTGSVTDEHHD